MEFRPSSKLCLPFYCQYNKLLQCVFPCSAIDGQLWRITLIFFLFCQLAIYVTPVSYVLTHTHTPVISSQGGAEVVFPHVFCNCALNLDRSFSHFKGKFPLGVVNLWSINLNVLFLKWHIQSSVACPLRQLRYFTFHIHHVFCSSSF